MSVIEMSFRVQRRNQIKMSGLLTLEVEMIKSPFSHEMFGLNEHREEPFHIVLKMHSKCSKAIRKINKGKIFQGKTKKMCD